MLHWYIKCCCSPQEFIFDKPSSCLLALHWPSEDVLTYKSHSRFQPAISVWLAHKCTTSHHYNCENINLNPSLKQITKVSKNHSSDDFSSSLKDRLIIFNNLENSDKEIFHLLLHSPNADCQGWLQKAGSPPRYPTGTADSSASS